MKYLLPFCVGVVLTSSPLRSQQVLYSEVMYHPAGPAPEFIEVWNISLTPQDMAKWAFTDGVSFIFPDFSAGDVQAHLLKPFERIVVSSATPSVTRVAYPSLPATVRVFGPWTGALDNNGERVTLRDKNGVIVSTLNYGDGNEWPAAADGTGHSLVLINENREADDFRNWKASSFTGGTPGNPEIASAEEAVANPEVNLSQGLPVVTYGDTWSFYREITPAPPTNWNTTGFTPAAPWGSGPGLLGFETAALPAPGLQTAVQNGGLLTYYFRRDFTWNGATTGITFSIDQINDDGAVYYLNGQELGRFGTGGSGPVPHNTAPAGTRTVTDAAEELNVLSGTLAADRLVNGNNVFAAVAIQVSATSSDMVFGARLKLGQPTTAEVAINEVKPAAAGQGFVEFYNSTAAPVDLNGYFLSDTSNNLAKFRISSPLVVPANGLATIGFAESNLTVGTTTTVYLTRPDGITPISGIQQPIPLDGRSLGRKPNGGAAWFLFVSPTPGQPNASASGLAAALALNEAHFTAQNHVDFVELKNLTAAAVSLSGLFVSSKTDFSDRIPLAGSLPASGYVSFDTDFDAGNNGALTLYLIDAQNNVLAAVELEHVAGRDSVQAWPEGGKEWFATVSSTRNAVNMPARETRVVINEIMFDPPSNHRDGEYIELYNKGPGLVSLAGWKLRGEVDFTFPPSATIAEGGYVVIGFNSAWLSSTYSIAALGNWDGQLSNKGGLVRLLDGAGNFADEVDYRIGGDWPELSGGLGSAIELVHPEMDNSKPSAWRESDESAKTAMQSFSFTDTYRQFRTNGADADWKELNVWLVGDSHVILQNFQVRKDGAGANLLQNPDRITPNNPAGNPASNGGWMARGSHHQSYFQGPLFHLISEGHGNNKRNMAECDILPLANGDSLTISFDARWVYGKHRLIVQTFDQSVGKAFTLPVPSNLGTPGAANSRASALPFPQVDELVHSPAVPRAAQTVKVTARVTSAAPLATVQLFHRPDNVTDNPATAPNWVFKPMTDDGIAPDAVPNDGIYSANLTEYPNNGQIAHFYVKATTVAGTTFTQPKLGAAQAGMFIVDNQTLPGDVRVQRLIISEYWRDALQSNQTGTVGGPSAKFNHRFPKIQSHYFPCVFIHNEKDVYYGAGMRKGGSPWTRPDDNSFGGGLSRGAWVLPEDRLFRGQKKRGYDNDSPGNGMHNRVTRYWLYLLGQPVNQAEFVRNVINNAAPAMREDYEPDNNQLLDRNFDNGSEGELFSVEDGWWLRDFDDQNRLYQDADWIYNQTSKSSDAPTRWHNEYALRTRENHYDYAALTSFIKMVSDNNFTQTQLESILDVDAIGATAAVRGFIQDWDFFLLDRGKNCFFYRRPNGGKFIFLHWDSDLAFGNAAGAFLGNARNVPNVMAKPYVRKKFIYFLNELLDKYTNNGSGLSPRFGAWLDAEEASSNSFGINKPFYASWCQNRRQPAINEINASVGGGSGAFTAPFALTAPPANTSANTLDFTGTAPSAAFRISVDGHPEAVSTWTNATTFTVTGIVLRSGNNNLTLRMFDADGNQVGSPITHAINKTGDAPPVPQLAASPGSYNVALGETLSLDASSSYDPEAAGPLAFGWSVAPSTGVTIGQPANEIRTFVFSQPGLHTVTLTLTDAASQVATIVREVAVFNPSDFYSFGEIMLDPSFTAANVENRDNYSPSSWYSLEDERGRLQIQVLDDSAKTLDGGNHPYFHRDLPDSANWVLQTDVAFDTRELGAFNTGLYIEMTENGLPVRYAFGPENKSALGVRRSENGGTFFGGPSGPQAIRINCGGPAVTETSGLTWQADQFFLDGSAFTQNFTGAGNGIINDDGRESPTLNYNIPVANGTYTVTLHSSGQSSVIQNVTLNGVARPSWLVGSGLTAEKTQTYPNFVISTGNLTAELTRTGGTYTNARLTGIQIVPPPQPEPPPVDFSALRIRRAGDQLVFSRRFNDAWIDVQTQLLPAGATAHRGGVFVATSAPQSLRMSFDYLMLVDPGNTNSLLTNLRLTELMYNPAVDGVEYLEFQNIGGLPLNLQGVQLDEGSPFAAFTFGNETLAPGELIVLTQNVAAFQAKYGTGVRLAGQWAAGGLNNAGERITVRDPLGNPIHDFVFDDDPPWPLSADGQGPSLEVIDVNGEYGEGQNWRASSEPAGSPGVPGAGADSDGDGTPDSVEAMFGTDPNDPNSRANVTSSITTQGQIGLSWPTVAGRNYRVDRSLNLVDWFPLQTVSANAATTAFTDPAAATNMRFYYRIVALP
ncbi:MAG: lamin tail domain-containing protein [Verrucomicrobiales bacterium]